MHQSMIPLSVLLSATIASAQSPTWTYILPGAGDGTVVASLIGSASGSTTMTWACPATTTTSTASAAATTLPLSAGNDECDIQPGMTVTVGPSVAIYSVAYDNQTASESCKLYGSTMAVCNGIVIYGDETSTADATLYKSIASDYLGTIVVIPTAGLDEVGAQSKSTSSAAAAATTGSGSGSGSESGSSASASAAAKSTGSSSSASATTTGTTTGPTTASGTASAASTSSTGAGVAVHGSIAGFGLIGALAFLL